jgi:tetratricopeptide (TPR) repeat protein
MTHATDIETDPFQVTHGAIAVINLQSAAQASWSRFWRDPCRPEIAELIVEQEQLAAQFIGDLGAFDRLDTLVSQLVRVDPESPRTALVRAQVASATHRFAEARGHLAKAESLGAPSATVDHLSLGIDQACGTHLDSVLEKRRRLAAESGRLEDRVPLGSLLADLGEFAEADLTYQRALREYQDVSPFAVAWVCFQLGVLWGELVPERELSRAARWYRKAIDYLPGYVKARVHLAEIHSSCGQFGEAESLLAPAVNSGDPEVPWRLADVMNTTGRFAEAEARLQAARSGFEAILERYLLAFADHGAEFFAGSGNDARRAFELASVNLANRPTLRAFEQAYATALAAGEARTAMQLREDAAVRWGFTVAFRHSPLAKCLSQSVE